MTLPCLTWRRRFGRGRLRPPACRRTPQYPFGSPGRSTARRREDGPVRPIPNKAPQFCRSRRMLSPARCEGRETWWHSLAVKVAALPDSSNRIHRRRGSVSGRHQTSLPRLRWGSHPKQRWLTKRRTGLQARQVRIRGTPSLPKTKVPPRSASPRIRADWVADVDECSSRRIPLEGGQAAI